MGLLTFATNVTLDGCVDHREGIADDETHDFFTRLMDESGAMLWGRVTYEMMESYWPAVARGAEEAPPAMREWAVKLEAKPKYVVSSTRKDFPWTNTHHIGGDLRAGVQRLKDATPKGVLLGSGKLATELDRLELIDEYKFLVPGSPATARPCTRAVCPRRGSSSWSRRDRSAAARCDALPPRPLIHRSPTAASSRRARRRGSRWRSADAA
jgi:dihydrofolate reductase